MDGNSVLDKFYAQGANVLMSSKPKGRPRPRIVRDLEPKPVWAEGLKRMYDSVVSEEIPDEIADLLKQLDETGDPD